MMEKWEEDKELSSLLDLLTLFLIEYKNQQLDLSLGKYRKNPMEQGKTLKQVEEADAILHRIEEFERKRNEDNN